MPSRFDLPIPVRMESFTQFALERFLISSSSPAGFTTLQVFIQGKMLLRLEQIIFSSI